MKKQPYIPPILPPQIDYGKLVRCLSEANRALGELKGLLALIPNQSILVSPLLTKEAVASSKIEGTQATIEEVFKYEAEGKKTENDAKERDIREIINYRQAIEFATKLLEKKPLGENFVKQLHEILLKSVRGTNKDRGNFRRIPVFIGKPGATIDSAIYIPPPANELTTLISNWEKYINSEDEPDILVQIAIAHYQFEAIHPFLDGNGRIGRLLIPIMLYQKNILSYPILYISEYFERNKEAYYHNLRLVDENSDWIAWITYFIKSISVQAEDTKNKVNKMLDLYKDIKDSLSVFGSTYGIALLDIIFANPVVSFSLIKEHINTKSPQTIYNLLEKFQSENILIEITGGARNRVYVFKMLMDIIK
ncbi:Fic family protein [Mucilaginibacter flavus]|uniref:Fic family protein n=1 Tax=Mucilaginibacter flavus TaxID=931504 RepID=UPI0025B52557|nr:Fic family protein [Mucilaginibacter flavus]MDN3579720.1 Fic family protein [Mucilaginibacter flavus]